MSRRKLQIEAYRYESDDGVGYEIYFPGSKQNVIVLSERMDHWEVKKLLFEAVKTSLSLLGLDGKIVKLGDTPFKFFAGRYVPIEGECRKEECPNFFVVAIERNPDGTPLSSFLPRKMVEVRFQRHETSTKAVALAVARSEPVEPVKFNLDEIVPERAKKKRKKKAKRGGK